ncbi:hypothetical protein COURTHOUSE_7 [Mycobacterium phage Courthouse]|uniref:Uncharacterized protein n=2 Tax=Omegavirus courthouse TaxID=1089119 RepID=G8I564_9CAUD|nr:hypothetical protein CM09_gp007 [Mycobacterium phage Courthouse]YP_009205136.1 hypothetical protein AVT17_gp006 [Mycobacterium phage Ariel]AER47858.1 hypothetical protein COURTHOUSE_7 [Mycobacterium phage Courthouse]AIM49883.1 hypothetical protein PBI_ARIEL_6 [Mycobacterium phage Ariel]ATS92850.1 hypothetical protein SEA_SUPERPHIKIMAN_7 [Mycobacterium phage Superphikiman]
MTENFLDGLIEALKTDTDLRAWVGTILCARAAELPDDRLDLKEWLGE